MTDKRYIELLRTVAMVTSLGIWITSINFSVEGFQFNVGAGGANTLMGVFLGFAVTVIQLVWNREANSNKTIMVIGIFAYAYGIYTNFIGIATAQATANQTTINLFTQQMIFPAILALFIEIAPEALLVWGLTGASDLGDFFGNILDDTTRKGGQQRGRNTQSQNQNQKRKPSQRKPVDRSPTPNEYPPSRFPPN